MGLAELPKVGIGLGRSVDYDTEANTRCSCYTAVASFRIQYMSEASCDLRYTCYILA